MLPALRGVTEAEAEVAADEEGDLKLPLSHGLAMASRAQTLGEVKDATSARAEWMQTSGDALGIVAASSLRPSVGGA